MKKNITIIGGDLRIIKLTEMLYLDGYKISICGMEKVEGLKSIKDIIQFSNIKEAIDKNNIIVAPLPLSKDGKFLNSEYSTKKIEITDIAKLIIKNKILIAGNIRENERKMIRQYGGKVIDLLEYEELAILNAIATAEGAIGIAIQELPKNLQGSRILVLGFGRIGKVISKKLYGIGADVYCYSIDNIETSWIRACGYKNVKINDLNLALKEMDVIINTIPSVILDQPKIEIIKKECLIIDLASKPGGVDKNAIKEAKINYIWALGLPGKVSPVTSAEYIKATLYNVLEKL